MGMFGGDPGLDPVTPEEVAEWNRRQHSLFSFDPSVDKDRLTLLPRYIKGKGLIAPTFFRDLVGASEAPGLAAKGLATEGDALNMMQNFAYGGLGKGAVTKQAPGELGMLLGASNIDDTTTLGKIAKGRLKAAKEGTVLPSDRAEAKALRAWVGPDSQPRYWVSDMGAKIDEEAWAKLSDKVKAPLSHVLKHPDLEDLDPKLLKDVKIKKMGVRDYLWSAGKSIDNLEPEEALRIVKEQQDRLGGFYDEHSRTLFINPIKIKGGEDLMSVVLHELSHDVQKQNKWLYGANATEVIDNVLAAQAKANKTVEGRKEWSNFVTDALWKMFPNDPKEVERVLKGLKSTDSKEQRRAAHVFYSQLHGEREANIPGEVRSRLMRLREQLPETAATVESKTFNPARDYEDIFNSTLEGHELDSFIRKLGGL